MKKKETEVDPRRLDLRKFCMDDIDVNVITTYDNDYDQQTWDITVEVFKPQKRSIPMIPNKFKINGIYSPEKHVLGQVINDIQPETVKPHLLKISLYYNTMGEVLPSVYENRDVKNPNDLLEIEKEMDELGYGFITRTNSKYYFQPDQRDAFETDIMETFKTSKKVRSYEDSLGRSLPEEEIASNRIQVEEHRKDTAKYFGLSA